MTVRSAIAAMTSCVSHIPNVTGMARVPNVADVSDIAHMTNVPHARIVAEMNVR
jgi:hypothetical protein